MGGEKDPLVAMASKCPPGTAMDLDDLTYPCSVRSDVCTKRRRLEATEMLPITHDSLSLDARRRFQQEYELPLGHGYFTLDMSPKCSDKWEIHSTVAEAHADEDVNSRGYTYSVHVEYDVCSYNVCAQGQEPGSGLTAVNSPCPPGTAMDLDDLTYPCSRRSDVCTKRRLASPSETALKRLQLN